jgi:hypothetical protein
MPLISETRNMWGRQGGENAQRSDLWQVDLTAVILGINAALGTQFRVLPRWYPASIEIPEPRVRAEGVRRASRMYLMPSWDEPFDPVKLSLIVDDASNNRKVGNGVPEGEVYAIMDAWRSLVRVGRGSVGSEIDPPVLDENYLSNYAFTLHVYLLRGISPSTKFVVEQSRVQTNLAGSDANTMFGLRSVFGQRNVRTASQPSNVSFASGLDIAGMLVLEEAWLSGFKLGQLAYQGSNVLTCDATIQVANVLQYASNGQRAVAAFD